VAAQLRELLAKKRVIKLVMTLVMMLAVQMVTVLVVQEVVVVVVTPMVVLLQWQVVVTLLVTITVVGLRLATQTCIPVRLTLAKPAVMSKRMIQILIHTILPIMNAFQEWCQPLLHGVQEQLQQQLLATLILALLGILVTLTPVITLQLQQLPQLPITHTL